jgi:uncharacterized protein YjbI with pentapeptide repeats
MSNLIIAAAVGLPAAVLLGAWWLWWRLPKRQVDRLRLTIRDPKARADVEDNLRKTIGQLLGGAVVLIGAGFAYLQFIQQQQASRDLLISNQLAKGFEQLGSGKPFVRLGGIYALEGVMNNSEQYHQLALEALSAFVRDGTRTTTGDGPPATDIQAALTVIGRRAAIGTGVPGVPDLTIAHIPKADLHDADLSSADLHRADLHGADLHGADLIGVNLHGADLARAELRGANLYGANLYRADLSGADLSSAKVTQAQLDQACGIDVRLDPGLTHSSHAPSRKSTGAVAEQPDDRLTIRSSLLQS